MVKTGSWAHFVLRVESFKKILTKNDGYMDDGVG